MLIKSLDFTQLSEMIYISELGNLLFPVNEYEKWTRWDVHIPLTEKMF